MNNLIYLSILLLVSNTWATVLPPTHTTEVEDNQTWNKYCSGDRHTSGIPKPNYQEPEVINAIKKLVKISPYSYYFYSGPLYAYNLKKNKELIEAPADFPNLNNTQEVKDGKKNAHAFMTVLCGEFRDRPTLIKDKVRWVNKMYTLPTTPQASINLDHELWSQISAESYSKYINNTRNIFSAKQSYLSDKNYKAVLGKYLEDYPVEPFTICETKFIFKKYVEVNKDFSVNNNGYAKYSSEYKKFKAQCLTDDLAYFYDFRGDSNFKPNSPESNGMIWYSSTITNSCIRIDGKYILKDNAKTKFLDPEICEKYFKAPFAYRWSAARAGLSSWLMRDYSFDPIFSQTNSKVTIVPNLIPLEKPFGFKLPLTASETQIEELSKNEKGEYITWDNSTGEMTVMSPEKVQIAVAELEAKKAVLEKKKAESNIVRFDFLQSWQENQISFWERPDIGFNEIIGFGTKKPNLELAFERLRDAVNRHTDWYASGYDDGSEPAREQAYSPFVASSYEMSASNGFTAPGGTVKSPADGCKHWMFVFKLKKDKWYTTQSIAQKVPVNFNYHWFDETSLGTNFLADSEHALDRLGTALEGEMDSILYLHNITTSGNVDSSCGAEQMKAN
ncbi:MAG: hypothetical protein WA160_04825 [Pseudobdellovibrio sp.]